MSLHKFHVPPEQCSGPRITLTGQEAHHAAHVLRLRPGDAALVLDGAGGEYRCVVQASGRHEVTLEVQERRIWPRPAARITLVQALPKGKTFDVIIQKATELGAARVIPLLSERSVPHFESEAVAHKVEKWRAVAVEAAKQCGTPWLPVLQTPQPLEACLAAGSEAELSFVASLQPGSKHPREYFNSFCSQQKRRPASLTVWVGPEGDFSPTEVETIQGAGANPITLGPLVLRADTAAVYCLSVLNYELLSPGL